MIIFNPTTKNPKTTAKKTNKPQNKENAFKKQSLNVFLKIAFS